MGDSVIGILFVIFCMVIVVLILVYGPRWFNTTGLQVKILDWLFPGKHIGQRARPELDNVQRFSVLSMRILWGFVVLLTIVALAWAIGTTLARR